MKILVTGAAGFIGSKTCELLLAKGHTVVGIDNMNDYYDVRLKKHRLEALLRSRKFLFKKSDIENIKSLRALFSKEKFSAVINLAARAGVPYSMKNPFIYVTTNTLGVLNILECCREFGVKKMVLASTSSLYSESEMPFKESYPANRPLSPYAASKKGAEALCHSYHYLYGMDIAILRYFTVYGPAGRPDMSPFRFIESVLRDRTIPLNGDGLQSRDFTFVDDIARGTVNALSLKGYEIINLGGNRGYSLKDMIQIIEKYSEKKAKIQRLPALKVDMRHTRADIGKALSLLAWEPEVSLDEGLKRAVKWHVDHSKLTGVMR